MKISSLKYLVNKGIENIWKNKIMTFATFCVLLISLILVGFSILTYINLNSMIKGLSTQNEIAVYIRPETSQMRIHEIEHQLLLMDNIDNVNYISKEEAYLNMKSKITHDGQTIFSYINDYQFMPDGFSVIVINNDIIEQTISEIVSIADIQSVYSSPQVTKFIYELRRIVTYITFSVIIALSIVSMIMISNTIKVSVYTRREEIHIMKYVGATDLFIRTPFFIEGMITGFFSGIIAYFITWVAYNSVYNIIVRQTVFINVFGTNSILTFTSISTGILIIYLIFGSILGAIGSVISICSHLNV